MVIFYSYVSLPEGIIVMMIITIIIKDKRVVNIQHEYPCTLHIIQ